MILFAAATFIVSCGNNNSDAGKTGETTTTTPDAAAPAANDAATAEADRGLELIAKSDCLTCHKVEDKLVGPAYR